MPHSNVKDFLTFINNAPTVYHACDLFARMLQMDGYEELNEGAQWKLQAGGRYYITRNGSALLAFTIPDKGREHFQVAAAHGDSPLLKLKPSPEHENVGYLLLNTEVYGGGILSTWFDRPLSIAGRVVCRQKDGYRTRLVNFDRDLLMLPNMSIHFNRDVNDGYAIDRQVDLRPVLGEAAEKGWLYGALAEALQVDRVDIVGMDLFVYDRIPGSVWGTRGQFFSAPRIDDLECAWCLIQAFRSAALREHIKVCAVFDNEEIGNNSRQGADSSFLRETLLRIQLTLGASWEEALASLSTGFLVSADNAHAVHPHHPEKYDEHHRVSMNNGVVLKYNANQNYTTTAETEAIFADLCQNAGVPIQRFANRSDLRGGGTLGRSASAQTSMRALDIGLAQLAMHSCYETAGCEDLDHLLTAMTAYYNSDILQVRDGLTKVRR